MRTPKKEIESILSELRDDIHHDVNEALIACFRKESFADLRKQIAVRVQMSPFRIFENDEAQSISDIFVSKEFQNIIHQAVEKGLQKKIPPIIPKRSKGDPKRKKWEALEQALGSYVHNELLAAEKVAHDFESRMIWMVDHIDELPAIAIEHFRTLRKIIRHKYGVKIHFAPEHSTPEDWQEQADITGSHPFFKNAFKSTVATYLAFEEHAPDQPDYIRAKVKDVTLVSGLSMEKVIEGLDLRIMASLDGLNIAASSFRKGTKRKLFLDSSGRLSWDGLLTACHHEILHCDDDCDIRSLPKEKSEDPCEYYAYHGERHFDHNNLAIHRRSKNFRVAAPKFADHFQSVQARYPRRTK